MWSDSSAEPARTVTFINWPFQTILEVVTRLEIGIVDPAMLMVWGGVVVCLLLASAGGFAGGVICAPFFQEWTLRRAAKKLETLNALVLDELRRSQRASAVLEREPGGQFSPPQWTEFAETCQTLEATLSSILRKQSPVKPEEELSRSNTSPWDVRSVDPSTGLPDKSAFDANLERLLRQLQQSGGTHGLLWVQMDRADSLRQRVGDGGVERLSTKLAAVIGKSVRQDDLVCRVSSDAFAVLMPVIDPVAGWRQAELVRDAVRQHRFRVDEQGPEILVTASFGYSDCASMDSPALLKDRVVEAVARSRALGRNQLQTASGRELLLASAM